MAQQTTVTFVDDLDGSEADGTVKFGLDGTAYEIDLNEKHATALRENLADYVAAARKAPAAGRGKMSTANSTRPPRAGREQTAAIRTWARDNGHTVSDRGRIPKTVVDAYNAAH
jgi:hypothetical protein